ncbi:LysE family translocator [Pseudomonas sp. GV071]|uniref:LysE family translocator n=1 Tax=Pseudomonas sp. GV071 TaxID=2135754 RepID=UPI000D3C814E|nr:LysE family transporter [Pseudomonas sp. GV071]PTQ72107.1 threonine/homoserine/homoserine lactone efflux protein [Pseudomonas sp. GV071]
MALHTWLVYLLAVVGLSLTPGPNALLALSHGALYGQRRTLFTIGGGMLGFTLLMALSMFGIGALLQASAHALTVLKWVGGAYLVWLGIQLWRAPPIELNIEGAGPSKSGHALFRQGLLSAISNPKVILFFGAFLPQFLDPERPLWLQFVILVLTFVLFEGVVEFLLARMAHRIRPWLERSGKGFNRCCGSLFALMGAALPTLR